MFHHHPADEKTAFGFSYLLIQGHQGMLIAKLIVSTYIEVKKVEKMRLICRLVFVFRIMADQRVVC